MHKFILLLPIFLISSVSCHSINPYFNSQKNHHTARGFKNPDFFNDKNTKEFSLVQKKLPSAANKTLTTATMHPESLHNLKNNAIQITWLGHSTVLLQLKGFNILFDPVFSNRASRFKFIGHKRAVKLPIQLNQLPKIDYVVLSHDHHDHLDIHSIVQLAQLNKDMQILTPLAYKTLFKHHGLTQVFELDWWEQLNNNQLSFYLTPAHHSCKRTLFDSNRRLWGSWVVKTEHFSFFFAGDTGYSNHFQDIVQAFGSFDLAALPIGGADSNQPESNLHMNAEQALKAHKVLNSRYSFAIHWGTFSGFDAVLEQPRIDLHAAKQNMQTSYPFRVLAIGDGLIF